MLNAMAMNTVCSGTAAIHCSCSIQLMNISVDWSENNLSHKFCVNWVHMLNDWKWVLRKHCCCASFNGSCRSVHYFTIYQGVNQNLEWLHSASRTLQWPLETTKFVCDNFDIRTTSSIDSWIPDYWLCQTRDPPTIFTSKKNIKYWHQNYVHILCIFIIYLFIYLYI